MMKIEVIEWISKAAQEARLTLSDGRYSLSAFCQPCHFVEGDTVELPLYSSSVTKCQIIDSDTPCSIEQAEQAFETWMIAIIYNAHDKLVQVGQFYIELDGDLPGDAITGQKLSFHAERIDLENIQDRMEILYSVPYDYTFYKENGRYYLDALSGGISSYQILFQLNEEESRLYQNEGLFYLENLVRRARKNNEHYFKRAKSLQ